MQPVIFVRERRKVEQGEHKPRYRIVGVTDNRIKLYAYHMRKKEIEQIASATGAQVVYLDAGKGQGNGRGKGAAPMAGADQSA